jgi:hypothetical protein
MRTATSACARRSRSRLRLRAARPGARAGRAAASPSRE